MRTVSSIFNTVWPFAILIVQVICSRMKLKYGNIEYIMYICPSFQVEEWVEFG